MLTKRLHMFPGMTDLRLEYVDNGYDVYSLMTQCITQCPLLECLWIIPTPATFFIDNDAPTATTSSSSSTNTNTNMSFLRLRFDDEVDNARLGSVLRLCPHLTRLSITTYSDPDNAIFDLCPQLQYLEWNPRTQDFLLWPPLYKKTTHQQDRLHSLATIDTALPSIPHNHMIQALTILDMSCDNEPDTIRFLDTCRHIKKIMFDPLESIDIPRYILPKLSHLSRLELSILDPDTADGLADYFVNHATHLVLETIELNLPIAHSLAQVLDAMALVTTLKHVELRPACVNEQTLRTYIMHAPQLEHLSIDHGPSISLDTFKLLGELPHLRILIMASYDDTTPVSGAGIKALVDKKQSNPTFSFSMTCSKIDDESYIKYAQRQMGQRFYFFHS
ncbi:hypothetical protein K492DRAFT_173488 [Lichtheimia hyalospora FSU 10163]|nr:hypothetical protein K492DRAFT_173488 [Lichtheimia hyalospora FSU 10163]